MAAKDKRISLLSEAFRAIKGVKMLGLEESILMLTNK